MLNLIRRTGLILIAAVAFCATYAADARSHHRAAKPVAAPAAPKPANVPEEKRDPADIALDRKIKGIRQEC